jgi:hypothetical protein
MNVSPRKDPETIDEKETWEEWANQFVKVSA